MLLTVWNRKLHAGHHCLLCCFLKKRNSETYGYILQICFHVYHPEKSCCCSSSHYIFCWSDTNCCAWDFMAMVWNTRVLPETSRMVWVRSGNLILKTTFIRYSTNIPPGVLDTISFFPHLRRWRLSWGFLRFLYWPYNSWLYGLVLAKGSPGLSTFLCRQLVADATDGTSSDIHLYVADCIVSKESG